MSNARSKERLPRLRFNSNGSVSIVRWGCLDTANVLVEVSKGRYLWTDPSVLVVACPMCEAQIGEPCKKQATADGYGSGTHFPRRDAYQDRKRMEVCEFRTWNAS